LLVDVNRPVPTAQLVDRVWAEDPPHRVRNVLAGYLSRLRTLLADADEVSIASPVATSCGPIRSRSICTASAAW
jgi:hypothetical protein